MKELKKINSDETFLKYYLTNEHHYALWEDNIPKDLFPRDTYLGFYLFKDTKRYRFLLPLHHN